MPTACNKQFGAHGPIKLPRSDPAERPSMALLDAPVGLNPHPIEAVTFAPPSTRAKEAMAADKVACGKTFGAGIVPDAEIDRAPEPGRPAWRLEQYAMVFVRRLRHNHRDGAMRGINLAWDELAVRR